MWIIPKNLLITYPSVADTVVLELDLKKFCQMCANSLMWRSKPSQLPTWLKRWKRVYWFQRLFGQTLKRSTFRRFEKALNTEFSQPVSRVSLFRKLVEEKPQKTLDTSGPTSSTELDNVTPCFAFWKTCKGLSPQKQETEKVFLNMSAENWNKKVIELRQEYSARQKSAHLTKEKGFLSWQTPQARDWKGASGRSYKGINTDLPQQVKTKKWPTPTTAEAGKISNNPNYGQLGLSNHPNVHGYKVQREKLHKDVKGKTKVKTGQQTQNKNNTTGKNQGQRLNPNWVEQLMGLPVGWTQISTE